MKSISKKSVAFFATLILVAFCFSGIATAKQANTLRMKIKIDLSSAGVKATKTGVSGGNDLVEIKAVVLASANTSGKLCSGPFKVKLEKLTGGAWVFYQHSGVTDICASKTMRKIQTKTVKFNDRVPSNLAGAQKYRVVIDYTNMVDEMNETNNIDGTRYIP